MLASNEKFCTLPTCFADGRILRCLSFVYERFELGKHAALMQYRAYGPGGRNIKDGWICAINKAMRLVLLVSGDSSANAFWSRLVGALVVAPAQHTGKKAACTHGTGRASG